MVPNGATDRRRLHGAGDWMLVPLVALGLLAVASMGHADDEMDRVIAEAGKAKYEYYCMPCHGAGGAPAKATVDLRTYVARHGGKFPTADWLAIVVDANPGNVHADVWERIQEDQETSSAVSAAARGELGQIARYVMSIQSK